MQEWHILFIEFVVSAFILLVIGLNISSSVYLVDNRDNQNWSNTKFSSYMAFLILSWIALGAFIIFRGLRWYNWFWNLFGGAPVWFGLILLVTALGIIPALFLKATKSTDKDDKDKKDKRDRESDVNRIKQKFTDQLFWAVPVSIIILIIFFSLAYILVKNKQHILGFIFFAAAIIAIVAIMAILILSYKKQLDQARDKDEYNPLLNTRYPPPQERDVSLDLLKKIKDALGDFKVDNDCDGKTCDRLYEEYIKSGGDNQTLENMLADLAMIDDKTSSKPTPGLINQTIYIVYQMIQCKIGLEEVDIDIYKFGTWDWWKKNIYMWGKQLSDGKVEKEEGTISTTTDPIQRYIYLIALFVCIIFFFYNVGSYALNSKKIFGLGDLDIGWLVYGLIATTFITFPWALSSFIQISKSQHTKEKVPVRNGGLKAKTPDFPESKAGRNSLIGYVSTIIGLTALDYFGGNTPGGKFGKVSAISMVIALILVFNAYYMVLIPQLVIIGLILQKYVLSTHIGDILPTIVKGIILVVILFASLYDTSYGGDKIEEDPDDPTRFKEKLKSEYNQPVWYIFGILMALYIQNILESFLGNIGQYKANEWSLLFMPMARYLLDILTKGLVPYSAISVKNTFI